MRGVELDGRTIWDAVEVLAYGETAARHRRRLIRTYANGRVFADLHAREAYSYGRHFPLFRFVPRRLSGARTDLFVINGDTWSGPNSRTRDHQADTRAAIERTGVPSLIVPFSALGGAGVDIDSIRRIDSRPDANWTERRESRDRSAMPRHEQTYWAVGERTAATIEDVPPHYRRDWVDGAWCEIVPDADGFYRWTEHERRPVEPDADGFYRWTVHLHRLGDCLFSAVRSEPPEIRQARPFEHERETARETVVLWSRPDGSGGRRTWCTGEGSGGSHEAGPSGGCVHCGAELWADVTRRTRRRYLSSFDMNENPPLYFLAAVPRNAGGTVAAAIDSLAPVAVHAAIARGVDVRRQGDVFFVATGYSEEELQLLGARFGRLTQWTRDAKPRPGEITYRPNPRAADRRREARIRRREWRRLFGEYQTMLTDRRPSTPAGWRRKNRAERRRLADLVAARRETLRRLLAEPFRYGYLVWDGRRYLGPVETSRYQYARRVRDARANVTAAERLLADAVAARMVERDRYRAGANPPATVAMRNAAHTAATRVRPWQVGDGAVWSRDRETVRRHLAVYGTAHSATRVAVLPGGATYVSGTVRHEPSLEPNRRGGRDHRPLTLEPGVWYLAVRNTVPRQNRRRTRVTV